MLRLIEKTFIRILTSIVSASNHTKCVLLSNQKCMTQPTPINLYPNEYSEELCYYSFAVNLDGLMEIAILLMNYIIKYVFQMKPRI